VYENRLKNRARNRFRLRRLCIVCGFVERSKSRRLSLSPILVRPVREQLEHDRVIRQLQRDLSRRKIEVGINPGAEQNVSLGTARKEYPDAVLFSTDKGRKVIGVVEVETGESVNNLEAMAQWAHYAKLRAPFLLYVPMGSVDVARRLAADNQIAVAEIHSYHQVGEVMRFTLVHRSGPVALDLGPEPDATPAAAAKAKLPEAKKPVVAAKKDPAKPVPAPAKKKAEKAPAAAKGAARPVKVGKAAKPVPKSVKPAAKAASRPAPRKAVAKKVSPKKASPKKAVGRK
jgi:hypothetical protein